MIVRDQDTKIICSFAPINNNKVLIYEGDTVFAVRHKNLVPTNAKLPGTKISPKCYRNMNQSEYFDFIDACFDRWRFKCILEKEFRDASKRIKSKSIQMVIDLWIAAKTEEEITNVRVELKTLKSVSLQEYTNANIERNAIDALAYASQPPQRKSIGLAAIHLAIISLGYASNENFDGYAEYLMRRLRDEITFVEFIMAVWGSHETAWLKFK